jgi:hypothetical protein
VQKVFGTIAGIVTAFAIMVCVDLVAMTLHAPPAGMSPGPEATARWLSGAPLAALLFIVAAWFLAAFGGGLIGRIAARWQTAAWVVAGVILISALAGAFRPPHPVWMQIAALVAPLLGGYLASRPRVAAPKDPAPGA